MATTGDANFVVAVVTLEATAALGQVGGADFVVAPVLLQTSYDGGDADFTVAHVVLDAHQSNGRVANASFVVAGVVLSSSYGASVIGNAAFTTAPVGFNGSCMRGQVGSFVALVRPTLLQYERASAVFGEFNAVCKPAVLIGTTLLGNVGAFTGAIASVGFSAIGATDAIAVPEFSGFVLNVLTGGGAFYDNYPFTSLFKLGNEYYGIRAEGMYKLQGNTDDGRRIQLSGLTGVTDLDAQKRKWITDAYIECRCDNQMEVGVILSEREAYLFSRDLILDDGIFYKHIKLGRGLDCTHVQLAFRNQNGSDVDLQALLLKFITQTRRM